MHATVHHGDALTILPTLPEDSVDCVIADPPYNSGGRTATERTAQTTRDKYVSGDATHTLADFTGDNRDQRSYTFWLTLLLGHCLRLARPCASLLVFTGWRQFPATSDALQAGGWTWRGAIAFHKPTARPRRGGFAQSTEYILWGTNGPVPATAHPVCLPGMLSGSQPRGRQRQHITQKPLDVIAEHNPEVTRHGPPH